MMMSTELAKVAEKSAEGEGETAKIASDQASASNSVLTRVIKLKESLAQWSELQYA